VNRLLAILVAIGGGMLGLMALFASGVSKGRDKERVEQLKKTVEQTDAIKKINNDIDQIGATALRNKLRDEFSKD
jgi:HAMP domain-containing protein